MSHFPAPTSQVRGCRWQFRCNISVPSVCGAGMEPRVSLILSILFTNWGTSLNIFSADLEKIQDFIWCSSNAVHGLGFLGNLPYHWAKFHIYAERDTNHKMFNSRNEGYIGRKQITYKEKNLGQQSRSHNSLQQLERTQKTLIFKKVWQPVPVAYACDF